MPDASFRYQSLEDDSGRWVGFPFRDGDIVISTPSRSGTTWTQMICALLLFRSPRLPAPLGRLSPWLDDLTGLARRCTRCSSGSGIADSSRRTTPLDGLPVDPRATYIVTARHPLDMAVSLYHHTANVDMARKRELTGTVPTGEVPTGEVSALRIPLRDWLLAWIDNDPDPQQNLDSLPGVMWHLGMPGPGAANPTCC